MVDGLLSGCQSACNVLLQWHLERASMGHDQGYVCPSSAGQIFGGFEPQSCVRSIVSKLSYLFLTTPCGPQLGI